MGLDYGFEWLKERYWEPQSKIIKGEYLKLAIFIIFIAIFLDYYIGKDVNTDTALSQSLKTYAEINIALFENQDVDGEYIERVKRTIYKRFRRTVDHPFLMLDILLEMITQSLEKDRQREQICLDGLVSSNALLKPYYDILNESDEEGIHILLIIYLLYFMVTINYFLQQMKSLMRTLETFGKTY